MLTPWVLIAAHNLHGTLNLCDGGQGLPARHSPVGGLFTRAAAVHTLLRTLPQVLGQIVA